MQASTVDRRTSPHQDRNQTNLPGPGQNISPFAKIPIPRKANQHSAFVRTGAAIQGSQNGPADEWPKMAFHPERAPDGIACGSQDQFDALGEGWSFELVTPVVQENPAASTATAGADVNKITEMFDRHVTRLQDRYDTLEGEAQALRQENSDLKIEIAAFKTAQTSVKAAEVPLKKAVTAAKENINVD